MKTQLTNAQVAAYLSLPTDAPMEKVKAVLGEPETLEQERERVFGTCGGKCGEAPCIAWNRENDRKKARRAERGLST